MIGQEDRRSLAKDYFWLGCGRLPERPVRTVCGKFLTSVGALKGRSSSRPNSLYTCADFSGFLPKTWNEFPPPLALFGKHVSAGRPLDICRIVRRFKADSGSC